MGVAYYPSFEKQISGYDPSTAVSGKPIARAIEQLEEICKRIEAVPLLSFYSESAEEAFALIGEPVPEDLPDEPITWSEPDAGLRTVANLIEYLRVHPEELPETQRILDDLEQLQNVLKKAQEFGTRFRLRIDS